MHFKAYITLIILLLTPFTGQAQKKLVFSPSEWDFGQILEADGPQSHTFEGVNRSDKPIILVKALSNCGCTVPEISRKPILPGEKTRIKVTFDPTHQSGIISKNVGIYSSDREKVASLTIRGRVTPRPKSLEEEYPVEAGSGLRVGNTLCSFTYIYIGKPASSSIPYANTTDRELSLELRPHRTSGLVEVSHPARIAPHAKGEINFSYALSAHRPHYGTLIDAFEVVVDGRNTGTILMTHGIGIDDPAPMLGKKHSKSLISKNIIKFGAAKYSQKPLVEQITLTNRGNGPLIIRSVECDEEVSATIRPGTKIAAGESLDFGVSLDPSKVGKGPQSRRLVLITNDPTHPMYRIRVTAVVE